MALNTFYEALGKLEKVNFSVLRKLTLRKSGNEGPKAAAVLHKCSEKSELLATLVNLHDGKNVTKRTAA